MKEETRSNPEPSLPPLLPHELELRNKLIESAEIDAPDSELERRIRLGLQARGRRLSLRKRRRWLVVPLAAIALVSAVLLISRRLERDSSLTVAAEPTLPGSLAPRRSLPPASPAAAVGPCAFRRSGSGSDPLVDDFEDGNEVVLAREGRLGSWYWVRDTDAPGTSPALVPERRPEATGTNRLAAHIRGSELRDWGASLEFRFMPSCYDASAYAGLAFAAKGPGRIYVAAREVRTIPAEWGGTCTSDCYNVHVQKVDLGGEFRTFEVLWDSLRQRGYGRPPLDPTSLHGIAFYVRPEDTPYDVWVDDVRFVRR